MPISNPQKAKIEELKREYDFLKSGKESLLQLIDEAEISESVYNSNAIENSTLTLPETEKILLEISVARNVSLREIFEAKNLARVIGFVRQKAKEQDLTKDMVTFLHKMLIGGINDQIAGRFRQEGEYVRVGAHIAPPPEQVERMIDEVLANFFEDRLSYFIEKVAHFHLRFESIHPFNDGNGRIGRVLINYQLQRFGFPGVIIRDKEKQQYYQGLMDYDQRKDAKKMEKLLAGNLIESLYKRNAYLKGMKISSATDFARNNNDSLSAVLNKAKRQTIPAFREKGVWKIGVEY